MDTPFGCQAVLNEKKMMEFLDNTIKSLGTAACPPYHLAIVVGGLSAEMNLKTVKMASTRYYDNLHTSGNDKGRAYRDLEWEKRIHELTYGHFDIIWSMSHAPFSSMAPHTRRIISALSTMLIGC